MTHKDVSELHGEEFADGLDEMASDGVEGITPLPSTRQRVVSALLAILSSNIVFWLAGFVDGLIVMYLFKIFKGV